MYRNRIVLGIFCLSISCSISHAETKFPPEQIEFFEKRIRPIFIEHCQDCHGAETQEASLRVDSRQALLKGGDTGPAIVPKDGNAGELLAALRYDPDGYQMPPDGKLAHEKIDLIQQWIAMGAPWPEETNVVATTEKEFNLNERARHWSFQPLTNEPPPQPVNGSWCRNEIDQFILHKLEEHQLSPAEEADRRTWIRRAYLDVIGLPPTPAAVEKFIADTSSSAFEKVVDELLASPHFGERWGRHWLDVVRYAESRGHEFDYDVANPWHYRDYVIEALNADVPFDRFVVEHVAGDLLTPDTTFPVRTHPETGANRSIVATGFWLLGEWVHSPVDIRQEEAERFDNMIDVYSKAFLGLTVACARCHDHKFDPIRQKDYYALQGFLQSSSYQQARFETMLTNEEISRELSQLDLQLSEKLQPAVKELSEPVLQRLDDYLLAARDVLKVSTVSSEDDLFESFESGTYNGWASTGDAFGSTPQTLQSIGSYQGNVQAHGKFFVNSHQFRTGQGDKATGTLTSPEFTIRKKYLHLLVGGGAHVGKTCVNLLVNGEVALSATGQNSNQMTPIVWDLSAFQEQTGRIEVVDQEQGGWGNIGLDHLVFSDRSSSDATAAVVIHDQIVQQVAESKTLDSGILKSWCEHLAAEPDAESPTAIWAQLCKSNGAEVDALRDSFQQKAKSPIVTTDPSIDTVIVADELIMTGPGYRLVTPTQHPLLTIDEQGAPQAQPVASRSLVEWNPLWNRLNESPGTMQEPGAIGKWKRGGRVLRTPTFEVHSGKVHCLVRGEVTTYAAVDSHITLNGPLHRKLVQTHPQNDQWHWISHDLTGYEGHGVHLEFLPNQTGSFAVQAIVQTDKREDAQQLFPLDESLTDIVAAKLTQIDPPTPSNLAKGIQEELRADANASRSIAFIANHPELFQLDSTLALDRLTKQAQSLLARRQQLISAIRFTSANAPCLLDGSAEDEYVFIRGNWKKQGETVPRRFLEVFGGKSVSTAGSGRYQLATAMIDPQQTPILPRVIVNRIWHHYFGRGICPTPNDLGHLGERPTHPELLDWLSNALIQENWSLKSVHRKILLSSTYRQSSQLDANPLIAAKDPDNMLLHRMNLKRLEGEAIRDSILTVTGRLDRRLYGPSVPIHLTSFLEGRGRPGQSGPVDGNGRRSLYLSVRRNFPEPFFQAFDFPTPHSSIGRRNVSNVPAQALAMMNNPLVVEQAKLWAQRLIEATPDATVQHRIANLFEQAFSRAPTAEELELGQQFVLSQLEEKQVTDDDPRAWEDYCHVLFNSKEFIFVK